MNESYGEFTVKLHLFKNKLLPLTEYLSHASPFNYPSLPNRLMAL